MACHNLADLVGILLIIPPPVITAKMGSAFHCLSNTIIQSDEALENSKIDVLEIHLSSKMTLQIFFRLSSETTNIPINLKKWVRNFSAKGIHQIFLQIKSKTTNITTRPSKLTCRTNFGNFLFLEGEILENLCRINLCTQNLL